MAVAARTASELDVEHKREMSEAEKLREVGLPTALQVKVERETPIGASCRWARRETAFAKRRGGPAATLTGF